jgi:hypothetical protein
MAAVAAAGEPLEAQQQQQQQQQKVLGSYVAITGACTN